MQIKTKKIFSLEIDDEESQILVNEIKDVNEGNKNLDEASILNKLYNVLQDSLL